MPRTALDRSRRSGRTTRGLGWAALVLVLAGLLLLAEPAGTAPASAAPDLPALTGRVVDNANLLSAASASTIESKLKSLEDKSGIQLVVATIKSLQGSEIEPYANTLFRAWKLGEEKKNNGVLLLAAPTERKARIEVGYGLEGTLTDAQSKLIIANGMVPRFKTGDYQGGIETGVDDVIAVVSTDQSEWSKRPDLQAQPSSDGTPGPFMIVFIVLGIIILFIYLRRGGFGRGGGMIAGPTIGSTWSGSTWSSGSSAGSGSSGSSDDNSISGGGGSSGGGGASDSW